MHPSMLKRKETEYIEYLPYAGKRKLDEVLGENKRLPVREQWKDKNLRSKRGENKKISVKFVPDMEPSDMVDAEMVFSAQPKKLNTRYGCSICNLRMRSELGLKRHMVNVHKFPKKTPETETKKKSIPNNEESMVRKKFKSDAYEEYPTIKKSILHSIKEEYPTIKKSILHSIKDGGVNRMYLRCKICAKMFNSNKGVNHHLRTIHRLSSAKINSAFEKILLYICSQCGTTKHSSSELKRHIRNTH